MKTIHRPTINLLVSLADGLSPCNLIKSELRNLNFAIIWNTVHHPICCPRFVDNTRFVDGYWGHEKSTNGRLHCNLKF